MASIVRLRTGPFPPHSQSRLIRHHLLKPTLARETLVGFPHLLLYSWDDFYIQLFLTWFSSEILPLTTHDRFNPLLFIQVVYEHRVCKLVSLPAYRTSLHSAFSGTSRSPIRWRSLTPPSPCSCLLQYLLLDWWFLYKLLYVLLAVFIWMCNGVNPYVEKYQSSRLYCAVLL